LWDAETGENIAAIKAHDEFVSYLAWSPVDDRLVSAGADGVARLWNTAGDNMVLSLPYEYIALGGWSPDGEYLTVGSSPGQEKIYQGMVAVWDFKAGTPLFETFVDKDGTWEWYTIYSPDGEYILARTMHQWPDITDANKLYILDSHTGEILRTLETGRDTLVLVPGISPDGRIVGVGDWEGTVYFWEADSGELIMTMDCLTWVHNVRWSPDGSKIAMLCYGDTGQIQVMDADTYEILLTIEEETELDFFGWFNWSPDSSRIAVAGGDDQIGTITNPIYIFDANSGQELLKIDRHSKVVSQVYWSPNGKRIVSGSTDDTTRIWDAETGAELLTLSTPGDWIIFPAWSADGQHLLVMIANATGGPGKSGVWRVWQTTEELIEYAKECCVFRQLTPEEREQFGLTPK